MADKKPKKTYTLNNFAKKELRKQELGIKEKPIAEKVGEGLGDNTALLNQGLRNVSFSNRPVNTTTFEPPATQQNVSQQPTQQTETTEQPQNYLLNYGNSGLPNSEVSTLLGSVLTGQTQQNLYDNVSHSLNKIKEGAELFDPNAGLTPGNAFAGIKFMNGLAGLSFLPITAVNEVLKQNPVTDWLNKGAMLPFELADELYTLTQKGTDYAFEKITGNKPDRNNPLSQELDEFVRTANQLLIGGKTFHETGKFFKKGMPEVKEVKQMSYEEYKKYYDKEPELININLPEFKQFRENNPTLLLPEKAGADFYATPDGQIITLTDYEKPAKNVTNGMTQEEIKLSQKNISGKKLTAEEQSKINSQILNNADLTETNATEKKPYEQPATIIGEQPKQTPEIDLGNKRQTFTKIINEFDKDLQNIEQRLASGEITKQEFDELEKQYTETENKKKTWQKRLDEIQGEPKPIETVTENKRPSNDIYSEENIKNPKYPERTNEVTEQPKTEGIKTVDAITKAENDIAEAQKLKESAPETTTDESIRTKQDYDKYIKETQDWIDKKQKVIEPDPVYKALNKLYEVDDLPTIKTEKNIKLSDIKNGVGQQIEDAINNVKNGLESKTEGKPLVVESKGKYYIQDGFHRIAKAIINNEDNIVVDIIYKKPKNIAEAYHKAKLTNDNPELIKKTEDILKADTEPYFETEEGKRLIEQPKPEEVIPEPTQVETPKISLPKADLKVENTAKLPETKQDAVEKVEGESKLAPETPIEPPTLTQKKQARKKQIAEKKEIKVSEQQKKANDALTDIFAYRERVNGLRRSDISGRANRRKNINSLKKAVDEFNSYSPESTAKISKSGSGNYIITIDGKPLRQESVRKEFDVNKQANNVENPEANKPFTELGAEERATQIAIAEDLDSVGTKFLKEKGKFETPAKVLKKGIRDIKDDSGKELTPEAIITREEMLQKSNKADYKERAEEILNKADDSDIPADADTSFNFGENAEKKPTIKTDDSDTKIKISQLEKRKKDLQDKLASGELDKEGSYKTTEKTDTSEQPDFFGKAETQSKLDLSTERDINEVRKREARKEIKIIDDEINKLKQSDYNSAKQTIKDALSKDSGISFGGLSKLGDLADPKVLKAVYDVAKYHYENGAKNIREFANKVIEDLGNWVEPHLKELWKKAKEEPLANKNAKKYFGTTNYIKEAGYITPKGELLDLSGKNQGGEPFTRALDHREISQASEGLTDMREFIDLGNVRFLPESSTFDILKPLTRKQEKVMTAIIRHYKGDVAIEVQNGKGEYRPEYQMHVNSGRELGKVYPKGTSPKVVFDDIRKFFEEEGTFKKRETEYQTALKSLQEKINRANMTFGLDTLPEVYTIAKYHTGKFAEWSKKVIKDVGNWIKPHLRNLYKEITKDRTGRDNAVTQGLNLNPIKKEVSETFEGAVDKIKRGADTIRKIIAPVTRGENAKLTAKIITEKNAELVRQEAIISEGFKEARKQFDKRSNADNLKMIDAIETGSEINNPLEKSFADEVRKLLDAEYKKVTDRKGVKSFIENYFPHIWEQDSQNQLQAMLSRRPLEGSKSFLKKRTIPTTREGIEAGLKPITYNPVDLALLKLHEMKKFNMAHEIMDNLKAEGLVKYIPADYFAPAGWTKLNDKIGTIFGDPGITATEYVDKHLYNALQKLATDLNIKHSRVAELRGTRMGEASPAGYVNTKYATPEDVLAHEIGHHLQFKYNLWDYLTGDIHVEGRNKTDTLKKTRQERVKIHKELRALADLRAKGEKVSDSHKRYLREKDEKMAVVLQAYTHIPAEMREVAPTIFSKFEKFIDSKPELRQIKQIKPSLVPKGMDMKYDKNGILIKGHYYLPEPATRIINNHLSPGLKGEPIFDIYRGISNTLNQVQLGASLFHASFTSGDANLSKLALGLMKISRGKKEGFLDIATSPIAFITNPVEGNKIRKDYLSDRPNNPELVNAITRAGGRISMDRFYTNDLYNTVKKAFKDGKYISGSLKSPFAMFEVLSKPVLEYLVPRQKLGVFSGLAKDILQDEAKGKLTKDQATERLQEAWRSVDNRMGQLVYDNLYWDHVVKDIAMASVRSVGWNLGTFRELGGGIRDIPKIITEKRLTPRTAYALALPIGIGLLGAVYSYLNGTPAESIKDLYFPRTGHKNKDGVDDRISLPSYMKDVFAYGTDIKSALNTRDLGTGAKTLSHKMHPAISMLLDLINNHDYFGNEISDNTPFSPEWFVDEAKYIAKQFRPFTVNNISEMNKQGESLSKQLQSFFGFQLAPGYIRRSDMQNRIYDTYQKRNGEKIISKPEAETRELKRELKDLYLKDKNAYDEKIADLLEEGKISSRELNSIESDKPTDIKLFKYLPADDKIELWNQMNKEEKQRYQDGLTNKIRKTLNLPYKIPSNAPKGIIEKATPEQYTEYENEAEKRIMQFEKDNKGMDKDELQKQRNRIRKDIREEMNLETEKEKKKTHLYIPGQQNYFNQPKTFKNHLTIPK